MFIDLVPDDDDKADQFCNVHFVRETIKNKDIKLSKQSLSLSDQQELPYKCNEYSEVDLNPNFNNNGQSRLDNHLNHLIDLNVLVDYSFDINDAVY